MGNQKPTTKAQELRDKREEWKEKKKQVRRRAANSLPFHPHPSSSSQPQQPLASGRPPTEHIEVATAHHLSPSPQQHQLPARVRPTSAHLEVATAHHLSPLTRPHQNPARVRPTSEHLKVATAQQQARSSRGRPGVLYGRHQEPMGFKHLSASARAASLAKQWEIIKAGVKEEKKGRSVRRPTEKERKGRVEKKKGERKRKRVWEEVDGELLEFSSDEDPGEGYYLSGSEEECGGE